VFKIKLDKIKLTKKNIIVGISICIIVAIFLIVSIIIGVNKSKTTSAQNIEQIEDVEEILINEEIGEYIDISQLQQNVIVEQNIEEIENIQNNTTTNNKTNNATNKNNTTGTPYYIKVNYGAQVVTIYKKDSEGNYTVPVKAMICSTGEYTPKSGVYKIQSRWEWLRLEGYVFGHYSTQIVGNILFHSVPYLEKNPSSLEYWEYDKLGTYASAGCVRLTVADALWIFNNCARGTNVEFYSSSDQGPIGKPSAKKISNAEGNLKNWDPTDPNPNNPWKNYKPEENKNTNTTVDKNNNTTNTEENNQISNNEIENNKTNTQLNEIINNEVSKNKTNNEIVNEINTNTTKTNEINTNVVTNETTDDKTTNTTEQNEELKNNKVNEEI